MTLTAERFIEYLQAPDEDSTPSPTLRLVTSPTDTTQVRTLDQVYDRLNEISRLCDGWVDGQSGRAVSTEVLAEARVLAQQYAVDGRKRYDGVPAPSIAISPTPDGGVTFEIVYADNSRATYGITADRTLSRISSPTSGR